MTSPRTPRQWPPGSPEPMDVAAVRSDQNDVVFRARDSKMWGRDWLATPESTGDGLYYRWFQMNGENASEGPMTLSEVLPETPEPPLEGSYFDRTTFADEEAEAARAALVTVPASQSVPAVPVSSTGGKETGEAAETATEALSDPKVELTKAIAEAASIPQWRAALAAAFLLDEGWRPPLPDSETEWGCRNPDGHVSREPSEAIARRWVSTALPGLRVLVRREVGPWIEVTS